MSGMAELAAIGQAVRPPVVVSVVHRAAGRVTGWEVSCSDPEHGAMPVLAPSRRAGITAGIRHVEAEHKSRGDVRVEGKLVATSRQGKPATAGYEDAPRRTRRAVGLTSPGSWHAKRKAGAKVSRSSRGSR